MSFSTRYDTNASFRYTHWSIGEARSEVNDCSLGRFTPEHVRVQHIKRSWLQLIKMCSDYRA